MPINVFPGVNQCPIISIASLIDNLISLGPFNNLLLEKPSHNNFFHGQIMMLGTLEQRVIIVLADLTLIYLV